MACLWMLMMSEGHICEVNGIEALVKFEVALFCIHCHYFVLFC